MTRQSVGDMTFYINLLWIGFVVLAALLILIHLAILILRPIAKRHAAKTDLDQIGQKVRVVKTIHPDRPGRIRYRTEEGYQQASAKADCVIRNGCVVLVLSVSQDLFYVRPLTDEERAELTDVKKMQKEEQKGPITPPLPKKQMDAGSSGDHSILQDVGAALTQDSNSRDK